MLEDSSKKMCCSNEGLRVSFAESRARIAEQHAVEIGFRLTLLEQQLSKAQEELLASSVSLHHIRARDKWIQHLERDLALVKRDTSEIIANLNQQVDVLSNNSLIKFLRRLIFLKRRILSFVKRRFLFGFFPNNKKSVEFAGVPNSDGHSDVPDPLLDSQVFDQSLPFDEVDAGAVEEEINNYSDGKSEDDRPWRLLVVPDGRDSLLVEAVLGVAEEWSEQFNIFLIWLSDDQPPAVLLPYMSSFCFEPEARVSYEYAKKVIDQVLDSHVFECALVFDAVRCRVVLSPIARRKIGLISFIGGVDAVFPVQSALREIIFWSTKTIFSSRFLFEISKKILPGLQPSIVDFLPFFSGFSGGNDDLKEVGSQSEYPVFQKGDKKLPSFPFFDPLRYSVVGVGDLSYENGVDLFVQVAARYRDLFDGNQIRWIWVCDVKLTDQSVEYALSLQQQIQRLNLSEDVFIIPRLQDDVSLKALVPDADLLLCCNRFSGFSSSVVSALEIGVPIVCFDMDSDLNWLLQKFNNRNGCSVACLDVDTAARHISTLLSGGGCKSSWGEAAVSHTVFSSSFFNQSLGVLIQNAIERNRSENFDIGLISGSDCINDGYFRNPHSVQNVTSAQAYVRSWATGLHLRKPYPGFHPGIYECLTGSFSRFRDPLADYLENHKPMGPWVFPVISSDHPVALSVNDLRIALHIHAYYPDMLPEILERIDLNLNRPDLFISVKDSYSLDVALKYVSNYKGCVAAVEIVPNLGRDIGPFLTAFGKRLVDGYDFIGHVHTKQSLFSSDRDQIAAWREFVMENTLGGSLGGPMIDRILSYVSSHSEVGIVFPDDPNVIGWDKNFLFADLLKQKLKILELPKVFNFPAGTMFWVRSSVLSEFVNLELDWADYPAEPLPPDGTVLHALERLFGIVPSAIGLTAAVTHVEGVSR